MNKRVWPILIVGVVGLSTLIAGGMMYRSNRTAQTASWADVDVPQTGENGEKVHALGPANAPVTLEEFGDFQCPPCGKLAPQVEELEREFGPKLRVIFRQLPLPMHAHAREAAEAAEAAGLQGKFWQMHGLLYREQTKWSDAKEFRPMLMNYAKLAGVNVTRFAKDLDGPEVKARLTADKERAAKVDATLTPTVFINGRQVTGTALSAAGIRTAIQEALAKGATK